MKNDITRDTFDRAKHFSRVLLQQGRVQLDADFNEQVSILLDYLRALTVDLIGPAAGPSENLGFALLASDNDINNATIKPPDDAPTLLKRRQKEKVLVTPGRYYLDGLMAQNDAYAMLDGRVIAAITASEPVVVYLDAWERQITVIEDDSIREKALGGPDTATRAKVEWAVRSLGEELKPVAGTPTTRTESVRAQFQDWIEKRHGKRPLLRADLVKEEPNDDPCSCSPESGYRGFENQLYRIEIHRPGPGAYAGVAVAEKPATFKWSRDNGSVVVPWSGEDNGALQVPAARDRARGFAVGQWVELSDLSNDVDERPGTLVKLKAAGGGSLTLDPESASSGAPLGLDQFSGGSAKVRRWDQEVNEDILLDEGAIAIEFDKWYPLEDGLQVSFPAPVKGTPEQYNFRSGDYWLIPARVATHDIEWPSEDRTNGRLPDGVEHHYALLGVLELNAGNFSFADMRQKFDRLALSP
ncbi:MAG: hypothetical protein QOD64_634 [Verrucomicrobiota bacterium]|jgi:hypothetical protein